MDFDVGSHAAQHLQHGRAGRIQSDTFDEQVRVPQHQGRGEKEHGRREIAWHAHLARFQSGIAYHRYRTAVYADIGSAPAQCNLGVIACL